MSNRTAKDASTNILFVPLNKLKRSPKNVRQVPHTHEGRHPCPCRQHRRHQHAAIPRGGAGNRAEGKPTGFYLVNAGEGRRLAQLVRAKRKEIKADEPVRCILDTEHSATEISLAENAIRTDMHPADQYEAFAKLHSEEGQSAEDIAARFGVTAPLSRCRHAPSSAQGEREVRQ
jgi:ParB family chromosome partitioning protein